MEKRARDQLWKRWRGGNDKEGLKKWDGRKEFEAIKGSFSELSLREIEDKKTDSKTLNTADRKGRKEAGNGYDGNEEVYEGFGRFGRFGRYGRKIRREPPEEDEEEVDWDEYEEDEEEVDWDEYGEEENDEEL